MRASTTSGMADNLAAGLGMAHLRRGREGFTPAEGILTGPATHGRLATRFPPRHTFSATELEQYATCPYQFFLERVLRVRPVEDIALAVDSRQRGQLAHATLATFHRRVNEAHGGPTSPVELAADEYDRLLAESLDATCTPNAANPVAAAFDEINRRTLIDWIDDYRRQHEQYDELWRKAGLRLSPTLFEVAFGQPGGGDDADDAAGRGLDAESRPMANAGDPSADRPLELQLDDQTVRIAGRIDRVDTGEAAGRTIYNVLDYKTSGWTRFRRDDVATGRALQLPLYAMAVGELLLGRSDAVPWQAAYWYLTDGGIKPRQALSMHETVGDDVTPTDDWRQIRAELTETVTALVEGMRKGHFPVYNADDHCTGHCPFSTVCRINQVRSLEKTWQPGRDCN